MGLLSWLGVASPAHIKWFTWASKGTMVGKDHCGNKYYTAKPRPGYNHDRRWVIYNGESEASKVPPEWHGWLHHQTDEIPDDSSPSFRRKWQKPHKRNYTGTSAAYRPPGHLLNTGKRDKATGDYEAWEPQK
jgi:NADH:ubiquinone oxidoreductase subunit